MLSLIFLYHGVILQVNEVYLRQMYTHYQQIPVQEGRLHLRHEVQESSPPPLLTSRYLGVAHH